MLCSNAFKVTRASDPLDSKVLERMEQLDGNIFIKFTVKRKKITIPIH